MTMRRWTAPDGTVIELEPATYGVDLRAGLAVERMSAAELEPYGNTIYGVARHAAQILSVTGSKVPPLPPAMVDRVRWFLGLPRWAQALRRELSKDELTLEEERSTCATLPAPSSPTCVPPSVASTATSAPPPSSALAGAPPRRSRRARGK